jgi:regulator of protease activity HflC (stomatin/prohibitin superfamily)
MKIEVQSHERVFLVIDGEPQRYLVPGRHSVFVNPFKNVKVERVAVNTLVADLDERRLKLVPADDLVVLTLGEYERAVVMRRGRPVAWLSAGVHQVWTVDRGVDRSTGALVPLIEVRRFDISGVDAPLLKTDVAELARNARDYVETTAAEGCVVMRYVDGRLDSVLPAGRHAAWNSAHTVTQAVVDLRERLFAVNGQEVMTKDRVTLRLNVSAVMKVVDPRRLATVATAPDDVVYLALQLSAREAITLRTLDELLAGRDALQAAMVPVVRERAALLGLQLVELGVKDFVLPGEMKDLLNKVIQAQKEAEANVILRREETAATRSLAQTAKVLSENPLLVRLKELEAYKDLAQKVGQVHLVLGEGAMEKLSIKA